MLLLLLLLLCCRTRFLSIAKPGDQAECVCQSFGSHLVSHSARVLSLAFRSASPASLPLLSTYPLHSQSLTVTHSHKHNNSRSFGSPVMRSHLPVKRRL